MLSPQAEVHSVQSDGALALHARSIKYGKLENGCLIIVPSALIKRLKQHFVTLPCGVDVIIGVNGCIWITETVSDEEFRAATSTDLAALERASGGTLPFDDVEAADAGLVEAIEKRKAYAAERSISGAGREKMARVHNVIAILRGAFAPITPDTIRDMYDASIAGGYVAADLLLPHVADSLAAAYV